MIDVLLATYQTNTCVLSEQLDSIRKQREVEVEIARREDSVGAGACANFAALLADSKNEYVAYSDQDDVWLPDKLAKCLAKMRELEARWGRESPLLVFSDAKVVDAGLNILDESLFHRIKVDPHRNLPRQLVLQNTAYGNTMLFNAALRDLVNPIPAEAVMHDHWTMLVASVFGHIGYVDEPLLLYRQHGKNIFGGADVGLGYFFRKFLQGRSVLQKRLYANFLQIEAFVRRFGDRAPKEFHALVGLAEKSQLQRVWTLLKNQVFKDGILRNLGTWLVV